MDKKEIEKPKITFLAVLIASAFLINAICAVTGAYIQSGSDIKLGGVASQKYVAPRIVENFVQTEKNRQAALDASNKMDPITERNPSINEGVKEELDKFFSSVHDLRRQQSPIFNPYEETTDEKTENAEEPQRPSLGLSASNLDMLLALDTPRYNSFLEQIYTVTNTIMERGIQELDAKTLSAVREEMDKLDLSSDMKNLGYQIIILFIEPNVTINEEVTQKVRDDRAMEYETIYYQVDQVIIDAGHIITLEAYTVLEELGLVKDNNVGYYIAVVGAVLFVALLFALVFMYISYFNKSLINSRKECLLLFAVYNAVIIITRLLESMPYQMVPILFCTLLVAMMIDTRLAIVVNLCATGVCFFIIGGNSRFILFYSLTGVFISLVSNYTTDRNKIIISSFLTSLINLVIFFVMTTAFDKKFTPEILQNSLIAAASGMLTVVLCFGSLPIWEAAFGIVTAIKLVDLTNPNSALLRKMTLEAPGTYHHSLIVGNLAETAAYDIGANSNLARAGAYYHDIGKLKYPQYFIENQVAENPHDLLDPYSSAQVICSHVTYGLELADQYKLPKNIKDFVHQHHGNSVIKYFYFKARELHPDTEVKEEDFRYINPIPQFKESAIVMLADSVEAAVRSMVPTGKSICEIEGFVRKIINGSLEDGQLMESDLTIKDIETITKSFMRVFKAMYHERIPYPTGIKEETKNA